MHKSAGWLQTQAFDGNEQHYHRLMEIAPWAILVSRHNRIVHVNPAALRLLGAAAPDEIHGRSPFDFIHPDSRHSVRRRIQRLLETEGQASGIEGRWLRLDGTILDVEITATVYSQEDGADAIQMLLEDVTDHKRTQAALRESEERYALAVNGSEDGIWDWNFLTDEHYLSPRWKELLGFEDHELPNHRDSFFLRLHPDDVERLHNVGRRHLERREPHRIELRLRHKDGQYRWFLSRGQALWDAAGKPTRMAGVISDITERKRTEESLREARDELERQVAERTAALQAEISERSQTEQLLRHSLAFNQVILDSLTAQVATLDANGRITAVNESWRQFARDNGNPTLQGAGIGANYLEVCQQADRVGDPSAMIVADGIEAVLNGALPSFSMEYPCHSPTERRWFELHVNPLIDKAGVVVTRENVTQRKLLEERFRQAVEMAPSAMVMVNGRGEVVLVNAQAEQVFGYRREELLGQPIELLVPERFRGRHPGYRVGFLNEPKARPMGKGRELFGLRQDGSEFPVEIGLTPIETEEGTMVLSAIVDISERKRAERQIETTLKEKTVLLNEVHHRVKNNLQVIASLLNLQAIRTSSPELRQALQESQNRVHAMALIHQLLYETRNFAEVRLAQYLERLLELQRSSLDAERIALRVDTTEVCLDLNRAIPCALIVNELVTNAVKHAFPDGRRGGIHIELRKVNDEVVLTVSDSGIGLPQAFDWQAAKSLGLQIVSLLADQMGGVIEVSNVSNGVGARFELCFKEAV